MTKLKVLAANHRVAYEKAKEQFLSPVIFEPGRNKFFSKRWLRGLEGLENGYSLKLKTLPGKFKDFEAVIVRNTHNCKVYVARVFRNPDKSRGLASCTCPDFEKNKEFKVPCKHIWMVELSREK